jgi:hypothetical protein
MLEADTQLSSFAEGNIWFVIKTAIDMGKGKLASLTAKHIVPSKIKKAMVKYFVTQTKLLTKEAEALSDFLLAEGVQAAMDKLAEEMANYDINEVMEKDISEMYEKFNRSYLEGRGPIIITFGQGNLFYKAARKQITNKHSNINVANFMRHVAISPIGNLDGSGEHPTYTLLDNDFTPNTLPSIFPLSSTHTNPVRNIVYSVSLVLPEEAAGMYVMENGTSLSEYDDFEYYEGYWVQGSTLSGFSKEINVSVASEEASSITDVKATLLVEPQDAKTDAFHEFNYYMGDMSFDAHFDADNTIRQKSDFTKIAIIKAISGYIDEHKERDSAWYPTDQKSESEIATCEDKLVGRFATSAFGHGVMKIDSQSSYVGEPNSNVPSNSKIYPFKNDGGGKKKIYQIGGEYVQGVCGGVKVESPKNATVCYELEDKEEKVIGKISGVGVKSTQVAIIFVSPPNLFDFYKNQFHVQVDGAEILNNEWLNIYKDYDYMERTYPVYISFDGQVRENWPEEANDNMISVFISNTGITPFECDPVFWFSINTLKLLENGHLADIKVTYSSDNRSITKVYSYLEPAYYSWTGDWWATTSEFVGYKNACPWME